MTGAPERRAASRDPAPGGLRNIIVAFNGGPASLGALHHAVALADHHGAHLTGLLAHGASKASRAIPAWFPDTLRRSIEETLAARATAIRSGFRDAVGDTIAADRVHWLEVGGDPDTTVADYARMYDLTILGQYENLASADELALHPSRISQDSGRPVMIVPKANRAATVAGHAVIAWDGMRTATGAVADALPLLHAARRITVLTIETGQRGVPLAGIDVREMLRRRGLACDWVQAQRDRPTIAETLLAYGVDHDADLLVMGLSMRTRASQLVIGNVTTEALKKTDIPIFLSQ